MLPHRNETNNGLIGDHLYLTERKMGDDGGERRDRAIGPPCVAKAACPP